MIYDETDDGKLYQGDCLAVMKEFAEDSIDLLVTDPPYGYSFMGKDWDKAVPSIDIWRECLRVLKPGAFCFVMSAPRQDVLSRMMVNLEDAGFRTDFTSIYWVYASGFPKAQNIGKVIDKRKGAERKAIKRGFSGKTAIWQKQGGMGDFHVTAPASPEAKALDGSYAGYQPKPSVEVIIVCMKPLAHNTYVDQALDNGKGVTWLDDCRVPYESENIDCRRNARGGDNGLIGSDTFKIRQRFAHEQDKHQGRFPANLLVSDDVLNDGRVYSSKEQEVSNKGSIWGGGNEDVCVRGHNDSGSFSRFFDLDAWDENARKVFPFIITPKPSKSEKNRGCEGMEEKKKWRKGGGGTGISAREEIIAKNYHPTVKPLKLFRYLIMLASRSEDVVLDPFVGSGTLCVAAKSLNRKYIGIDLEEEYCEIAKNRIDVCHPQLSLLDCLDVDKEEVIEPTHKVSVEEMRQISLYDLVEEE